MKRLIWALGMLAAIEGRAEFLSLSSDGPGYAPGSRAVIFFDAKYKPSREEYHFKAKFDGADLSVFPLTNSMAIALTPRLEEQNHAIEGLLYQQDRSTAGGFEKTIAYFHYENVNLRIRLRHEKEEAKRRKILENIAANEKRIDTAKEALEKTRKFVQIEHLVLPVTGEAVLFYPDAFLLQADRSPAAYAVGESATFYAHLNTLFNGPDGKKEPVFKALIGTKEVPARKIDDRNYSFATEPFAASNVGANEVQVTLKTRSLARANRLREAKDQAMAKRDELIALMGKAKQLEEKRYFQLKAEQLNTAIQALTGQIEAIALPVDVKTLSFTVSE